jgi:hypothetical protein
VEWVNGESDVGTVALVYIWVYFCCCSVGCCVRDYRGLGLCKVGTVG